MSTIAQLATLAATFGFGLATSTHFAHLPFKVVLHNLSLPVWLGAGFYAVHSLYPRVALTCAFGYFAGAFAMRNVLALQHRSLALPLLLFTLWALVKWFLPAAFPPFTLVTANVVIYVVLFRLAYIVGQTMVLPSQLISPAMVEQMILPVKLPVEKTIHKIPLVDGNPQDWLSAAVFHPKTTGKPRGAIIYTGGNGECWEAGSPFFAELSLKLGLLVVGFNYRGTATSRGDDGLLSCNGAADMYADLNQVVQYTRDRFEMTGDRRIMLFGHSIGGAVAAKIVADDSSLLFVADRTFGSLGDAAAEMFNFLPRFLVKSFTKFVWGEMDVVESWSRISNDRKTLLYHSKDEIIRYDISLHKAVAADTPNEICIEIKGEAESPHNTPLAMFPDGQMFLSTIRDKFSTS